MNELNVTEQETIRGLLQLGWSRRRIARETGHHRATIDKVANDAAAEAAQRTVITDTVSAADVEAGDAKSRSAEKVAAGSTGRSRCEPHRWFIAAEVAKGRNAVAIYQDLVEHHGYVGAYNAVKRFVRSLCPTTVKTSCRFETEPGYEAQVDYGEGALTKHPQTGTIVDRAYSSCRWVVVVTRSARRCGKVRRKRGASCMRIRSRISAVSRQHDDVDRVAELARGDWGLRGDARVDANHRRFGGGERSDDGRTVVPSAPYVRAIGTSVQIVA